MSVLRFEKVAKRYQSESVTIEEMSLAVGAGEFTALSGPSGSGKTTLLNLAAGLDRPTAGRVFLLENDITLMRSQELCRLRRERLGFIFQSYNLFPVLTAIENVEYTLALIGVHPKLRRGQAKEALNEVGLASFAKRFPKDLSGGQQQRVAVARAIVTRPALVLADEPTANLDSRSALSLIELFQLLNEKHGTTFLFSSHDGKVLGAARRVIEVADGKISSDTVKAPNAETKVQVTSAGQSGTSVIDLSGKIAA